LYNDNDDQKRRNKGRPERKVYCTWDKYLFVVGAAGHADPPAGHFQVLVMMAAESCVRDDDCAVAQVRSRRQQIDPTAPVFVSKVLYLLLCLATKKKVLLAASKFDSANAMFSSMGRGDKT
jgi:hypothetical protein